MSNTLLDMPAKPLTPEQKQDAARLAAIFERRKAEEGLTQAVLADSLGYSVQSAVSQYLKARIPLNIPAAIKFSEVLRCRVADFSPSIQSEIDKIATFATRQAGQPVSLPRLLPEPTRIAIELLLLPEPERGTLPMEVRAVIAFMESTAMKEARREKRPKAKIA